MKDMDKKFNDQKETIEINTKENKMQNVIQIKAVTMTPLTQIDSNGKQRSRYIYEDGHTGRIPFFSANGFRGGLRRMATRKQIEEAKRQDPDITITPDAFYLYSSGAALDKKALLPENLEYEEEVKIRKNTPILSLFGAGLSQIEGKLAVTDLVPSPDTERLIISEKKDGTVFAFSPLMGEDTFFRSDSIDAASLWSKVLGKDLASIRNWRDEYMSVVAESKKEKEKANKKAKKEEKKEEAKEAFSHIKQPIDLKFMMPGVTLTSSIGSKFGFELNDIEIGCILNALLDLSMSQIGSHKRLGFGVLSWEVKLNGELMFETKSDKEYVLFKEVSLTDMGKSKIEKWEEYLSEHAKDIKEPLV